MSDPRFVGELGVNSSCLTGARGRGAHRAGVPFLAYLGARSHSQGCHPHSAFVPCSKEKDFSLFQALLPTGGPGSMDWALQTAAGTGISIPGISPALLNVRAFPPTHVQGTKQGLIF